jgi:hypothetical protein
MRKIYGQSSSNLNSESLVKVRKRLLKKEHDQLQHQFICVHGAL